MNDPNNIIKVLVVDDSAFMRKVIVDMLNTEKNIKVIDTARNGVECIQKAKLLKPDIITLDLEMPVLDGLGALAELVKLEAAPKVIMLSSVTHKDAEHTIKALELGAVDFVTKPTSSILNFNINDISTELINKIHNAYKSKNVHDNIINRIVERNSTIRQTSIENNNLKYIIAIGTSTGGPRALQGVIPLFPADIQAAILIVQHMPPGFTNSLAIRLNTISNIKIKEAQDGELIKAGHAYIAPGDFHMLLSKTASGDYKISTNKNPLVSGHRPSVNIMMESVANSGHNGLIAVMMTGMGNDGSEGILKIKKAKGFTIAQNEETCVVYGMPKAAVNIGAIDKVVPLQEISKEVLRYMGVQ